MVTLELLLTVTFPIIAILISKWSTKTSIFFLVSSVVVNLIPGFIAFGLRKTGLEKPLLILMGN